MSGEFEKTFIRDNVSAACLVYSKLERVKNDLSELTSLFQCDVNRINCEKEIDYIFDIIETEVVNLLKNHYEKEIEKYFKKNII